MTTIDELTPRRTVVALTHRWTEDDQRVCVNVYGEGEGGGGGRIETFEFTNITQEGGQLLEQLIMAVIEVGMRQGLGIVKEMIEHAAPRIGIAHEPLPSKDKCN